MSKFLNDLTTEIDILNERDCAKFVLKISYGRLSYIATTAVRPLKIARHRRKQVQNLYWPLK